MSIEEESNPMQEEILKFNGVHASGKLLFSTTNNNSRALKPQNLPEEDQRLVEYLVQHPNRHDLRGVDFKATNNQDVMTRIVDPTGTVLHYDENQIKSAVCQIFNPQTGEKATGFHYGDGCIITNSHVVDNGNTLNDVLVRFSNNHTIPSQSRVGFVIHVPDQIPAQIGSYPPDFALFRTINSPPGLLGLPPGFVDNHLAYDPDHHQTNQLHLNQEVYCPHYARAPTDQPLALPEVAHERVSSFVEGSSYFARQNTNTTFGSSGAPILTRDHKIVGIHFSGNALNGTQDNNETAWGVLFMPTIAQILDRLVSFLANVHVVHGIIPEDIQRQLRQLHLDDFTNWTVTFFYPGCEPLTFTNLVKGTVQYEKSFPHWVLIDEKGNRLRCLEHPRRQQEAVAPLDLNLSKYVGLQIEVQFVERSDNTLYGARIHRQGKRNKRPNGVPLNQKGKPPVPHKIMEKIKKARFFEKVNLTPNFLPARFLSVGALKARAVVRIVTPSSYGTGFLCAPGFIMTNNHMLPSATIANQSIAEFFYEENEQSVRVAFLPKACFVTSKELDFSVVAIQNSSEIASVPYIPLRRNPFVLAPGESVNIIQHPRARKKEIAIHDNKVVTLLDTVIHYETDTEPGSSGSPVFNNDWNLVALHHSGWEIGNGKANNEGIRIPMIVQYLLDHKTQKGVPALLGTVEASWSPNFGVFGLEGLSSETSRMEAELTSFVGTDRFADIGFWNIEHFNNGVGDGKIAKVAKVIARLNLDVLGLSEVQDGALDRLQQALLQYGEEVDYVYNNTPGAQDIALLYDTKTTTVEDKTDDYHTTYADLLNEKINGQLIFPRKPLFAKCSVEEAGTTEFIAIVVHLKAMGDSQSRARRKASIEALRKIILKIRETEGLSVVCGGDYNEPNMQVLDDTFNDTKAVTLTTDDGRAGHVTWIGGNHPSMLDHIVVTDNLIVHQKGTIQDVIIVRLDQQIANFANEVSDHVPIALRVLYPHNESHGAPSSASSTSSDE